MPRGGSRAPIQVLQSATLGFLILASGLVGPATPRAGAVEGGGFASKEGWAEPSRGTLPLGRLVLAASEMPGLRPRRAGPSTAKQTLATALRPARLPPFAPRQTQAARFGKGRFDVTSLAFVMKTTAAATAAATAIGKGGRGSRVRLGHGGFTLNRRRTALVWHRGRVLAGVVVETPSARARIAFDYARAADARIERALSQTAYSRVVGGISRKGTISRRTALDLFALAFDPLPGTKQPAGRPGRIADGTLAAREIIRFWKTLTPAQRTAAASLLGIQGIALRGLRWPSGSRAESDFGDPNFTPDVAMTAAAKQFAAYYQQKIGFQLKLDIVAGPGSAFPGALAYALPIDAQGMVSDAATICRVTVAPAGLEQDATGRLETLAHEVFHCMQYGILGTFSTYAKLPAWVSQGTAEWAALKATGAPWPYAVWHAKYLDTCDKVSLYQRVEGDGLGFFGHTDDSVEDFWQRAKAVVELGAKYGNTGAFDAARGNEAPFLDSWASSALIAPKYGLAWTSSSPVQPPAGSGCAAYPIVGDSDATSEPLTVRVFIVEDDVDVERPLLHIGTRKGRARISDGTFVDQMVKDAWFCVEGECTCPEGTEGSPPPAPTLILPAALGVTGGTGAGGAALAFVSLEEFCKEKQKDPVPIVPIPEGKGGGGGGKSCTDRCGQSFGDPHLITFDGVAYDFMAAGEFTLVRSKTDDLEIQVRQQPYPGSKWVSITTGAAMRVTGNRVVVFRGSPLQVRINGRPALVTQKALKLPRGGTVRSPLPDFKGLPRRLELTWPDGTFAQVWEVGDSGLALLVSPGARRAGTLVGLLGNADRRKANDFATRGGRALSVDALRPGTRGRSHRTLYRRYGDSWRITRRTSLFDYAPGQSPATFTARRFPRPAPTLTLAAGDKRLLAHAQAVCRRMRIKDPAIEASCVVDVLLTRDFDFATTATRIDRAVRRKKAVPPRPAPTPPPKPADTARAAFTYRGTTYTYVARKGSGEDGCDRDDVGGIDFRIRIGTQEPDKWPYFELAAYRAPRDGTWAGGNMIVQAGDAIFNVLDFTVTLTGKRTRGTFKGRAPDGNPVSGSFRC